MHGAYLTYITSQAAIVLLATFSQIDLLDAGGGQTLQHLCSEHRSHRVTCKMGMIADMLAVKYLLVLLADQKCNWGVFDVHDIDTKPSPPGTVPKIFASVRRVEQAVAKIMLPGGDIHRSGIAQAGIQFAGTGKALEP